MTPSATDNAICFFYDMKAWTFLTINKQKIYRVGVRRLFTFESSWLRLDLLKTLFQFTFSGSLDRKKWEHISKNHVFFFKTVISVSRRPISRL